MFAVRFPLFKKREGHGHVFLRQFTIQGFVYVANKAKTKATSLLDGFIEIPIQCLHSTAKKIKEKKVFEFE